MPASAYGSEFCFPKLHQTHLPGCFP